MHILLPIYPAGCEMISANLGIGRKDGIVTYIHSGMPIYSHAESDYRSFRFITSKFILQGLCRMVDISTCFHVSYDSVKRYVRRLEECGDTGFFTSMAMCGYTTDILPVCPNGMCPVKNTV